MEKLLVIGASGLLGSKAYDLGKLQYETYGTYSKNARDGLVQLDVTNRNEVFKLLEQLRPNLVVDAHALNNVDYAESHTDEAWKINVDGSRNVAEASKVVGAKYVFVSSDYVYSGKKKIYTEKVRPDPLNFLGKTKWAMEDTLDILDIDSIVIRTSGLYGKVSSTGKKSFVQFLIDNLQRNERTSVLEDQFLSYTLVDDVANAIFALTRADQSGIFNVVGEDCLSKYKFSLMVCKEFRLDSSLIVPCKTQDLKQIAKRPERVRLSTRKLRQIISQVPVSVKKGLDIIHKEMGA